MSGSFFVVRDVCRILLSGIVLQAHGVSAGNGRLIDWRDVPSGEELFVGDAFDIAQTFVAIVGEAAAEGVCLRVYLDGKIETRTAEETMPSLVAPEPQITAFRANEHGKRARSFWTGGEAAKGWEVQIPAPYTDITDEQGAEFARRLAVAAQRIAAEVLS